MAWLDITLGLEEEIHKYGWDTPALIGAHSFEGSVVVMELPMSPIEFVQGMDPPPPEIIALTLITRSWTAENCFDDDEEVQRIMRLDLPIEHREALLHTRVHELAADLRSRGQDIGDLPGAHETRLTFTVDRKGEAVVLYRKRGSDVQVANEERLVDVDIVSELRKVLAP